MNAILGYSQLLQRDSKMAQEHRQAVRAIARSGDHLLALINDVLEMSRIEAGHIELHLVSFNLRALLADMDLMFRVRTDVKGLELKREIDDALPEYIKADENRVRQVLINLLSNAVKFTDKGSISMRAYPVASEAGDASLVIICEVEDTGCGLAEQDCERVFGSFEQASAEVLRRGGTGLGLAISRSFAEAMQGEITVESVLNQGSCFRFLFVVEQGDMAKIEPKGFLPQVRCLKAGQAECRVLVVDDRATNRDLLCRMLEKVGFVCKEAENGLEGL